MIVSFCHLLRSNLNELVQVGVLLCNAMLALFAFTTWRANRRSVELELLLRVEASYDSEVAQIFSEYLEGKSDWRVQGCLLDPPSANVDIDRLLRWFSTLWALYECGVTGMLLVMRYQYQIKVIAMSPKIKAHLKNLADYDDGRMLRPYYGFVRLSAQIQTENKSFYRKLISTSH